MSTDIKSQFMGAVSRDIKGGAGSMHGAQMSNVPGTATITSVNGSPIVTFDTLVSNVPKEASLPSQFETPIRKSGI